VRGPEICLEKPSPSPEFDMWDKSIFDSNALRRPLFLGSMRASG